MLFRINVCYFAEIHPWMLYAPVGARRGWVAIDFKDSYGTKINLRSQAPQSTPDDPPEVDMATMMSSFEITCM